MEQKESQTTTQRAEGERNNSHQTGVESDKIEREAENKAKENTELSTQRCYGLSCHLHCHSS
jgi:hypothetical protein